MTEVTSEPRAFLRHLRANRICHSGARQWWASHGLNWDEFIQAGIPVTTLEAIGDNHAKAVAASARGEHSGR